MNIAKGCLKKKHVEASSVWIGGVSEVNSAMRIVMRICDM